jgi:hypothetical protein
MRITVPMPGLSRIFNERIEAVRAVFACWTLKEALLPAVEKRPPHSGSGKR